MGATPLSNLPHALLKRMEKEKRLVITKVIFWRILFQLAWKYTFYVRTDNGIFPILVFQTVIQ